MSNAKFTQIFQQGEPNDAYAQFFTGHSYLAGLVNGKVPVANVTFEPGCRNNWHIHHGLDGGGDQILLCTAGEGWYQADGEEAVSLTPGTAIRIPAGTKHWHGAKVDSWFSHLAFTTPGEGVSNEWLEPVSDADYTRLPPATHETTPVTAGREQLGDFAPKFAELNDDVLFGQVWARTNELAARERSIVTVTALMASGILDSSLEHHIRRAKDSGVTAEEMAEILTHAAFYAGWPKAWGAFRIAQDVYAS